MQCSSGSNQALSASSERSSRALERSTADSSVCSALESSALPRFTDTAGNGLEGGYEPLALDRVAPEKERFHVETERALFDESAGPSRAMLGSEYDLLQTEECEIDEEFGAFVTALDDTERELFTVDAKSVLERFATLQLEQASTEASLIHPGLESLTLEQRYGLGAFMVTMIAEKEDETRQCYGHVNTAQTNSASIATSGTSPPTGLVSVQAPEWTAPVVTETINTSVLSAGQANAERRRSKTYREHAADTDRARPGQDPVDEEPHGDAARSGPSNGDRSRLQSNDSSFAERYARLLLSGLGLMPSQVEALMYLWRACLEGDLIPGQRTELIASTAALIGTPAVRFSALQAMLTLSLSPGSYDARCRVFLRDAARALRIPWRKMNLVEYAVAALLQQQQEQHGGLESASVLGSWSETIPNHSIRPATRELSTEIDADAYALRAKKRYRRKSRRRAFKVAAMALGGGALFGLAGALAAPLLLPALVGIGITGASALAATGTVASGAVVGSFFGGLGAGYVGHKARKRTRMRLTDFELEPLGVEEAARAWRQQQTENDQTGCAAEQRSPDESSSPCSVFGDTAGAPRVSALGPSTPDADTEEAIRLLEAAIRDSLQSTLEQHHSDSETITAARDDHQNESDDSERAKMAPDSVPASPTDTSLGTSNRDQTSEDDSLEQIRERLTQTSLGKERDATAIQPMQSHKERREHRSWRRARRRRQPEPEQKGGGSSSSFAETRFPQSASQAPAPMLPWPSDHGQGDAESSKVFALAQNSADLPTSTPLQRGEGFRRSTPAAMLERRMKGPRQPRSRLPSTPANERHLEQPILPTPRTWNGTRLAEDEASTALELMADEEHSVAETEHGSRTSPMATDPLATTSGPRLSHSLHLAIFVPGWLTRSRQEGACASQFYSALGNGRLLPFAERFALRWEPGQLYEMGRAFLKFWTTKAATTAAQQAAPHLLQAVSFAAGALLSSIAWPLFVYSAADIVDGPWSVLLNRANAAGDALADMLALREHGQRPVTLIGYSHGARVVFKCLEALADAGVHGVVDDAFLIGAPCTGDGRRWLRASRAVAGRLVNAYCGTDWALALFHRGSSGQFRVAGLSPIRGCHWSSRERQLGAVGARGPSFSSRGAATYPHCTRCGDRRTQFSSYSSSRGGHAGGDRSSYRSVSTDSV
ncbi:Transmembrane and coiled-coil domain-containing protein 4 [Cyanidiococcus yangmingshanensis]|uniref:Transmembrane and coiled-coil domain-containing protein 4 n=1 Tax=Cyanidiococcus yangmingshanensis TaxID=2690220 RepID=A0A7J7IJ41_9RHOD|nr:Transmembrane and coiled-coil domain-containing protein 4 [Cyanidiococcus yangmingshanensis]